MSIINKMLQDLDSRQGMSGSEGATAIPQVRSVSASRTDREWFWRVIALLMVVSLGWVAWIAWQLQPRESVATVQAFKAAENAKRAPAPVQAAIAPAPVPVPVPVSTPLAPAPAPAMEPEKLARQAVEPRRKMAAVPVFPRVESARKLPVAATAAPRAGGLTRLDLDVPPARILPAPAPVATRVQKQDRTRSAEERAEADFRRGATLLNEGRVSEAEGAFTAALATSSSHGSARQALVALYLEQRRIDDAQRLLQESLAANPSNAQFALVLARIHAGRREYGRALEVLNGASANAQSNPEYLALVGNVLERLGRHAEAGDAFRAVLRLAPANSPAWAGLGISLESMGRRPEAIEAYQRALATAPSGSDLGGFAEQRLRALR